jgi:hypothetical protein
MEKCEVLSIRECSGIFTDRTAVRIFRVTKFAVYVNASGSSESVHFLEITKSWIPRDGKFHSNQPVNLK